MKEESAETKQQYNRMKAMFNIILESVNKKQSNRQTENITGNNSGQFSPKSVVSPKPKKNLHFRSRHK
eukprot:15059219-Ditylum_brightwellii.AAC.1